MSSLSTYDTSIYHIVVIQYKNIRKTKFMHIQIINKILDKLKLIKIVNKLKSIHILLFSFNYIVFYCCVLT